MAKVYARETAFVGIGDNREIKLEKGELFDSEDQMVVDYPSLFAPVAESADARMAAMESLVAEQAAQIETLLAATGTSKAAAAKKTTAAKTAAGTELKGEAV